MKVKVPHLLCFVSLFLMCIALAQPLYGQEQSDLITVDMPATALGVNSEFYINVHNLANETLYVFAFVPRNFSRVEGGFWTELPANMSLHLVFRTPVYLNDSETFDLYIVAISKTGETFQWVVNALTVSSVESLSSQLAKLLEENNQLRQDLLVYLEKTSANNVLIIIIVVSNAAWAVVLLFTRLFGGRGGGGTVHTGP